MAVRTTVEMQLVPIADLTPYERNARTHSTAQIRKLRASIREFGFVAPVLIDRDGTIIAGHGRVTAAKAEGIESVPCVYVDHLTPAQKRAYILADNRLTLDGGWDAELLRAEMDALKAAGIDLNLTGFEAVELNSIFDTGEAVEDNYNPDEVLDRPEPATQPGDVWTLGDHRLICGDSTDPATLETLMGDARADLVVTDPPYNVGYTGGAGSKRDAIANDDMADADFEAFLGRLFASTANVMKDDAAIYVFHAHFESVAFFSAFRDAGFKLSELCVWVKTHARLGRQDYQWQHEPVLYGWKGKHHWFADRKQTTVWRFPAPNVSKQHPTMKPIPLMAYPIKNSTAQGMAVLDPCAGSGSTLMACAQIGRRCYTAELEPKYCDVVVERYVATFGADRVSVVRGGESHPYGEIMQPRTAPRNGRKRSLKHG